jgi:hypothetical protein
MWDYQIETPHPETPGFHESGLQFNRRTTSKGERGYLVELAIPVYSLSRMPELGRA